MPTSSKVQLKTTPLRELRERINQSKKWRVGVGIFSDSAARHPSEEYDFEEPKENNPSIGLAHEFGSKTHNLPRRSWLRLPLLSVLPKRVSKIKAILLKSVFERGNIKEALVFLGLLGEQIIQEGFNTEGWGSWPQWSKEWAERREFVARRKARKAHRPYSGPGLILTFSSQLRKSVSSRLMGVGK